MEKISLCKILPKVDEVYRHVLPKHKDINMGSSVIHLHAWSICRHDRYEILKVTIKIYFILYETHNYIWDDFQLKYKHVHLDSSEFRHKRQIHLLNYIKKRFTKHKINIVSHAVITVEN